MALKTVSQLRDSVSAKLSGVNINNVEDVNAAFEFAASTLIQRASVPEASGVQNIVLYNGVTDYNCDTNIFGTEIKDIRPQGISRLPSDYTYKTPSEQFDRTKNFLPNGTMATFEYDNGVPIIRIVSKQTIPRILLDPMNATAGWESFAPITSFVADYAVYYQSPASLRFSSNNVAFQISSLIKTLTSPVDLSSYEGVGVVFLALRIPDGATASDLTQIDLYIGSDESNLSLVSVTTAFLGSWTAGNWMLVSFDLADITFTFGTPDWSSIQYVQLDFSLSSGMNNIRVGGLWISQPYPSQILYQS